MNIAVPVSHEIDGVSFAFCTSKDILKVSVKSINNPQTFDPQTNHANAGGLYDPALGPSDKSEMYGNTLINSCTTCHLDSMKCPGHFGHIDLAVSVYHPLLFGTLFSLLRSMCFYCKKFKVKSLIIHKLIARIKLANAGLIKESLQLENLEFEVAEDDVESQIDNYVKNAFISNNLDPKKQMISPKSTIASEIIPKLIKDFFKVKSSNKKCDNCGARVPSIRKEGNSKIFKIPLSGKEEALNDAGGLAEKPLFKKNLNEDSEEEEMIQEEPQKKNSKDHFLTTSQVKEYVQQLWKNEYEFLDLLYGIPVSSRKGAKRVSDWNQFFLDAVAVPPCRFRPISKLGDQVFDHAQNTYLSNIIKSNNAILELRNQEQKLIKQNKELTAAGKQPLPIENFMTNVISNWIALQENVNNLNDSSKNPTAKDMPPGIKQIMEKKEGLFRKHMMGKRVNFAARSVISPDPMIDTDEIGIPLVFAKKLTYPEPVTSFNIKEMRQAVINGPNTYPGAVAVEDETGNVTLLQNLSEEKRIALANSLLTPSSSIKRFTGQDYSHINKKVLRHLRNGDMLLANRQPTLHKPSIMGHIAKVLPGEKTIRMHYANCNTYNADFDGDEMNLHFPQNAIAQAEARLIANTNNQYLVPTSGEPLRGLIQDHVVTGVRMTCRDTFLTAEDYNQLIFSAIPNHKGKYVTLPPAIQKPVKLWTGKQVISTLLLNLTIGKAPLNLNSKSQTPSKSWAIMQAHNTEEGDVIFREGNLLTGVLDKKQFGAKSYGLVHACFEVYGPDIAGSLLTALGRLFTAFTRNAGFTCRMDDLILLPNAELDRTSRIEQALSQGKQILKEFAFGNEEGLNENQTPFEKQLRQIIKSKKSSAKEKSSAKDALEVLMERKLYTALEDTIRSSQKLASLDNKMKSKTGEVTTGIVQATIPNGLFKSFPDNGMQLMTVTGAKGSNVNVTQISCLLGQQELEGRRVPVMVSGKTLPSFRAYDLGPRAGGYITGRFLTGIKPQEYYFHCMAGREGLVDTAVKTARSGYLQRCLIKHLESLTVNYDCTVRDSNDGSVYQFHYGEDSLDVTKSTYLKQFAFNAQNYKALRQKYNPAAAAKVLDLKKADKHQKKALKKPDSYDTTLSKYHPATHLGSVSESFTSALNSYIDRNPDRLLTKDEKAESGILLASSFQALMNLKYVHSLVEPGESVGLLAAQSVGEPSTQMTLNTFHFAGHGAKNVTLGIPRLREIIMTASSKPTTPQMTVKFNDGISKSEAESICRTLSRISLDMIIEEATVCEKLLSKQGDKRLRSYTIRLDLWKQKDYEEEYSITSEHIENSIELAFIPKLLLHVKKQLKGAVRPVKVDDIGVGDDINRFKEANLEVNEETEPTKKKIKSIGSDDEEDAMEMDATSANRAKKHKQQSSYDAPDDDDQKMIPEDSDDESSEPIQDLDETNEISEADRHRKEHIIATHECISDYRFDKNSSKVEIDLQFPANAKKLLLIDIIEKVAPSTVIQEIKGISKCFLNVDNATQRLNMTTDGSNIKGLWKYGQYLDIQTIQTNDIYSILQTYGVEAARTTIMNEISSVFAVYGIEVDRRHLSLISDYMTFEGGYKPFNRRGIESNVSPFTKMSFETTFQFLTDAAIRGESDNLASPSARLVLGKLVGGGTGSFEILSPLK